MNPEMNQAAPVEGLGSTIYAAVEVSATSWVLGIGSPAQAGKVGLHSLKPRDTGALAEKIGRARDRAGGAEARVLLTYEAGCEGFWLARYLSGLDLGIEVVVCDPASLEVSRHAKKAKTDKIDAKRMVRALKAWDGGETDALSQVRVPSVEEEDAKRLLRERQFYAEERTRYGNRIQGLLKLHGIFELHPRSPGFMDALGEARTPFGEALPSNLMLEIGGLHAFLALAEGKLKEIEARKEAALEESEKALEAFGEARREGRDEEGPGIAPVAAAAAVLIGLRGIGLNDALLLQNEVLCREFENRRQLAGWAGLAPVPWASGPMEREQGISKAGPARVRSQLIQMAWRWLRFQPESDLAKWFHEYCAARDGRSRKRGIVALARKLLVALWRQVGTGAAPGNAAFNIESAAA